MRFYIISLWIIHLSGYSALVFTSTLPSSRTKFDPRATPCVFIGYPPGTKGYKLFDIQRKRVFVSRGVIFHENIFPCHSSSSQSGDVDIFPSLVLPIAQSEVPNVATTDTAVVIFPSTDITSPEVTPASDITTPLAPINRRSVRNIHPPTYLRDYHCNLLTHDKDSSASSSDRYPLDASLNYS